MACEACGEVTEQECTMCVGAGFFGEPTKGDLRIWQEIVDTYAPAKPTVAEFCVRFEKMFGLPPTQAFINCHKEVVTRAAIRAGEMFRP